VKQFPQDQIVSLNKKNIAEDQKTTEMYEH